MKGVCIITHGSSNNNAIKNAIRVAAEFVRGGVNARIEKEIAAHPANAPAAKWMRILAQRINSR